MYRELEATVYVKCISKYRRFCGNRRYPCREQKAFDVSDHLTWVLELEGIGSTQDVTPSFTSPASSECEDMRRETLIAVSAIFLSLKDWPLVCCDLLHRLPDP